jgi:hypothetical protein
MRNPDRGLGASGISKYLVHYLGRVPPNEAIGRHIPQNNRTSGNNCTLADCYSGDNQATDCNPASLTNENGRNLELEIFPPKIVASGRKITTSGDANIRFDCHLRQALNPNVISDPNMIANGEAPGAGDINIAAKENVLPDPGTKGAKESSAETRSPGIGILKENRGYQHPQPPFPPGRTTIEIRVIVDPEINVTGHKQITSKSNAATSKSLSSTQRQNQALPR